MQIGFKDLSEIDIIYDLNGEYIKIFGSEFVKNNINKCIMIINNKEYEITDRYHVKNYYEFYNNNKILKIK